MQFNIYKHSRAGRLAKQATNNQPTDQPTNQPTNQLTSQPTNRGADLPNYSQNKRLRPPVPRILHREEGRKEGREEGRKGSLLGTSNLLKIGYV